MSKKFKLGSLGTRQFNRRVPNAKQEEEKKKVFTMVKVRKGKMWGKLRGTNSKSDEIPHPNCDIKAYGCSSPLTLFLKTTNKNQLLFNSFSSSFLLLLLQTIICFWMVTRTHFSIPVKLLAFPPFFAASLRKKVRGELHP